ncbi:DMT family transporter [Nonomuraea jiangxiensis]|uniref:Drug/metabolite transporter, DME family n=1 Tax=Nonomuraea jiangxiensis TaxID=633440 RepID=A0A1G8ZWG8_9ACTN|nr:EamA family transporter [Nonomuraea jiangxiensis]SDK19403.1 drug/metabolite transporter, DME family [Nonomuraea jiangxiensis]
MTHVSARRGAFYVSVAATAWGTGGAAGSLLFETAGLGPVGVSLWRYLIGAALLLALTRPLHSGLSWRVLPVGAGMALYQTAYFAAIAHSGVAVATVVTMGATPVFTALGSRFLLRERLGGIASAALAAALAGLVLLTAETVLQTDTSTLAGIGFALASAAGYAGVTLFSRHHRDDPRGTAVGGFVVGAACLAPFALADGVVPEVSLASVGLLLYLGAVPTALAYGLFFRALTALRATTVSIISLGEAVGAAVLGVVLFGERLTPLAWSGCALLLLAVTVLAVRAQEG